MIGEISTAFRRGDVIPYLGPGVTALSGDSAPPALPEKLVTELVAGATVPHKIRNNLTAAAQYIENFKHRKTLTCLMGKAFALLAGTGRLPQMDRGAGAGASRRACLVRRSPAQGLRGSS